MHISKEKADKIQELIDNGTVMTLGTLAKELGVTVEELIDDAEEEEC